MVSSAEGIADFRQAVIGQFLGQRHRDLTRPRHRARAALGEHVGHLDLVVLDYRALDIVDTDQLVLQGQKVLEGFADQFDGDVTPHEVGMGDHPF
ncbi:hypothetical protein D3C77_740680 [compost metagenome]